MQLYGDEEAEVQGKLYSFPVDGSSPTPRVAELQNLPFVVNFSLLFFLSLSVAHRSISMCAILKCQHNGKQMSLL